jgi:hypothetical protein
MATANKKLKIFTKIKNERKGVRGKPMVSPYLVPLQHYILD